MDNDNTNVQQGLNLEPKQEGVLSAEQQETQEAQKAVTAEQPTEQQIETLAYNPTKETETVKAEAVTEDFVKGFVEEKLGDLATPELLKEFNEQLKEIGITDKSMAEKALNYVCTARENFMVANTEASLKHFNSTFDNVTPEYAKAVSEAAVAVNTIESKVAGFKQMINMAGIQGALPMILAMQMLKPLLTEDGNYMNGGTGGTAAPVSVAEQLFGADKIRKE